METVLDYSPESLMLSIADFDRAVSPVSNAESYLTIQRCYPRTHAKCSERGRNVIVEKEMKAATMSLDLMHGRRKKSLAHVGCPVNRCGCESSVIVSWLLVNDKSLINVA